MGKGGLPMPATSVQKLARVLKVLVTITFICNLIALALVPGLATMNGFQGLTSFAAFGLPGGISQAILYFVLCWRWVWTYGSYFVVLTFFLFFCGVCTAVILWQARRVLDNIMWAHIFTGYNADNLRRAAVCCFLISAAALVRLLWGFWYYASIAPLLTYNALFIPIFFMGGLLCLVMSALFRQAAELKAENDLTI